jgi:hypothetical protein
LGVVADFCSICHGLRPFILRRLREVGHLWFVPLTWGKHLGHDRICTECGMVFSADPAEYGKPAKTRAKMPLEQLIDATHPDLVQRWGERIELELRLADGHLTAEERRLLVIEPLVLLNPMLRVRRGNVYLDRVAAFWLTATICLVVAASYFERGSEWLLPLAFAASGLTGIATLIAMGTSPRRFARRQVQPLIVRALWPLQPTIEELDEALKRCRTHGGLVIGKWFNAGVLRKAIDAAAVPGGTPFQPSDPRSAVTAGNGRTGHLKVH